VACWRYGSIINRGETMKPRTVWYYDAVSFEKGMIKAWEHTKIMCNACIKAHREELGRLRAIKKTRNKKQEAK